MHVNPVLDNKALVILFNPLQKPITRNISIPLYYTGLTKQATVIRDGKAVVYSLDRSYNAYVKVTIAAGGYTWFTIR
jgi:hypothetical protein